MNTLQSNPVSQPDIDDVNIKSIQTLITPAELKADLPLSETASQTVLQGRATVRNILDGKDKRLFVVIGPCSIHDPAAAVEYAKEKGHEPAASGAIYGGVAGGMNDEADEFIKMVMAQMLDEQQALPPLD